MSMATSHPGRQFDHPALLYRNATEYLTGTLRFIRRGLRRGEPVMVAVPTANLHLIRAGLGADAGRVQLHDMSTAGRNPGRIIPGVLLTFANAHPGRRVRIVGEPIWPGRTAMEYPACAQHEALINSVFATRHASILCPYDVANLDESVISDAYRTHPVLADATARWDSSSYGDPGSTADEFNQPLPDPPMNAATITVTADVRGLPAIRRFTMRHGAMAGLNSERAGDLALAVTELATNTIEHTKATGTLALWTDTDHVICQLKDSGYIVNPLAGRIPPPHTAADGRGLLLVNHLCDLVRIHTRHGATTIRLHLRR